MSHINIGSFSQPASEAVASGLRLNADETSAVAENPAAWVKGGASLLLGPEEQLQFLARKLVHVSEPGSKLYEDTGDIPAPLTLLGTYDYVLLGTPIYVAQTESN